MTETAARGTQGFQGRLARAKWAVPHKHEHGRRGPGSLVSIYIYIELKGT